MPVRPENIDRYPANWREIRERILARADNKCEKCGVLNHEVGYRDRAGWHVVDCFRKGHYEDIGNGFSAKCVEIVLTIAHLDHTPENCADDNLRAWCQKCHNAYDAPVRAAGIKARRRAFNASGDLFSCEEAQ